MYYCNIIIVVIIIIIIIIIKSNAINISLDKNAFHYSINSIQNASFLNKIRLTITSVRLTCLVVV